MSHIASVRSSRMLARRIVAIAAVASLAAGALPLVGISAVTSGPVATTAQVLKAVAAAPSITTIPPNVTPALQDATGDSPDRLLDTLGCLSPPEKVEMPACLFGDPTGKRTLVLYGDSHAAMWAPAFDAIGKRIHWKIVVLAKAGCGAPDIPFWDPWRRVSPFKECDQFHTYALGRINRAKPDVVVLASEYLTPDSDHPVWPSTSAWTAGLEKTIRLIRSPRTKKVVLGDIPYLGQSAPECLAAHEGDLQSCSLPAAAAVKTDRIRAEQVAAAQTRTPYIKVAPWFCSATCTAIVGNKIVYFDLYHASRTYVVYLSGTLQSALRPVLTRPVPARK